MNFELSPVTERPAGCHRKVLRMKYDTEKIGGIERICRDITEKKISDFQKKSSLISIELLFRVWISVRCTRALKQSSIVLLVLIASA